MGSSQSLSPSHLPMYRSRFRRVSASPRTRDLGKPTFPGCSRLAANHRDRRVSRTESGSPRPGGDSAKRGEASFALFSCASSLFVEITRSIFLVFVVMAALINDSCRRCIIAVFFFPLFRMVIVCFTFAFSEGLDFNRNQH